MNTRVRKPIIQSYCLLFCICMTIAIALAPLRIAWGQVKCAPTTLARPVLVYSNLPVYKLPGGWVLPNNPVQLAAGTPVSKCTKQSVGFGWGGQSQTWYEIRYNGNTPGYVPAAAFGEPPGASFRTELSQPFAFNILNQALASEPVAHLPEASTSLVSGEEGIPKGSEGTVVTVAMLLVVNGLGVLFKVRRDASRGEQMQVHSTRRLSISLPDLGKSLFLAAISILIYSQGSISLGATPAAAFLPLVLASFVNGYGFRALVKDLFQLVLQLVPPSVLPDHR
jgi:hypothetical protein